MRLLLTALPLATLLVFTACGSDPEEQNVDPCRGISCPEGYDCQAGRCVVRTEPEPQGCTSNNDCQFSPSGPLCERESGRCVQCLETAHCAAGRNCEVGICVGEVCTTADDCEEETPICLEDGSACVQCTEEADCGEEELCVAGSCAADERCVDDEGCAALDPDTPFCAESGACVACTETRGCEAGESCVEGVCQGPLLCSSNDDCDGDPDGPICDLSSGACVVCLDDASCTFPDRCVDKTSCEPRSCDTYADCPVGTSCDEGGCVTLGQCGSDLDCAGDPRVPRCSHLSICVECVESSECGLGRLCNQAGSCVDEPPCTNDFQCEGGFVCAGGSCEACRTDAQCPRGRCVEGACSDRPFCTDDSDCAGGSCVAGSCVECASDLDCRPGLWCDAGACAEAATCSSNEDCGPGRLCDGFECQDAGCVDDSFEPDDDFASARPLRLGEVNFRTLCPNDEDWFTFTAQATTGFQLSVPEPLEGLEMSLIWFDPDDTRTLREQGMANGIIHSASLPPASGQRYYIRVRGKGGASGAYGILPESIPGICGDAYEPNNTWSSAKRIPADTWIDGLSLCGSTDQDFYLVDLPAGRSIRAYAVIPEGSARVVILNGGGSNLPDQESATLPYLGGTRVGSWDGGLEEDVERMIRIIPEPPTPVSYQLYVATVPADVCEQPPLLLDEGQDRARVRSATLGHATPGDKERSGEEEEEDEEEEEEDEDEEEEDEDEEEEEVVVGLCGRSGPEVGYELRLDAPARLVASVDAPFDAILSLVDGVCGPEQSCMPATRGSVGTLDIGRLEAGSYVLLVGAAADQAGPFDLAVRLLPPHATPSNDLCVAPEPILLSGQTVTVGGTTEGAGRSGEEAFCASHSPDVFYRVTLPEDGRLVAQAFAEVPMVVSLVGSDCSSQEACGADGVLDLPLEAGDHLLRVASRGGAGAPFTLELTLPPVLPHDSCEGALPLAVPSTTSGDTTWADDDLSYELAQSCTGYYTLGNDLFYKVSLGAGQTLEATLTPDPSYDAALYLIRDCAAAQCLAGSDRPGAGVAEELEFTAPQAGEYILVVDGAEGGGEFSLQVE